MNIIKEKVKKFGEVIRQVDKNNLIMAGIIVLFLIGSIVIPYITTNDTKIDNGNNQEENNNQDENDNQEEDTNKKESNLPEDGWFNSIQKGDNSLLTVRNEGKYGFMNMNGKIVIDLKYDYASSFQSGLAIVGINGKYGYINENNQIVIPLQYSNIGWSAGSVTSSCSTNLLAVQIGDNWGCIDKTGKVIIPIEFDKIEARNFDNEISNLNIVEVKGKKGVYKGD